MHFTIVDRPEDAPSQGQARGSNLSEATTVVWHPLDSQQVVRPEDWPVMPVTTIGFVLQSRGFFDRNPAFDVPRPMRHGECCHPG